MTPRITPRLRLFIQSCSPRSSIPFSALQNNRILPLPTLSLRHMSTRGPPTSNFEQLRSVKRRKIELPSDTRLTVGAMATGGAEPVRRLELTETETTLRQILLDVAEYIETTSLEQQTSSEGNASNELTAPKIVLRFTGGWVRDKLLGVESHDIDVAINNMTGYQFGLKMKEYLEIPGNAAKYGLKQTPSSEDQASTKGRKIGPGLYKIEANPEKSKHLETVTTKILGLDIDLVNLRKETYSEESRNPQMEFGTPEEDALRRDATVNAMFYNLNTSTIEDFTKRGFQDMQSKIIRTPLESYQTFKDDPLRVLRLIRFASRLGYTIDPDAEQAMANAEIREALKVKISRERVGIEIEKMLKGPDPHTALVLIDRLGLYSTIFTDPTKDHGFAAETDHLKPAYNAVSNILSSAKLESIPDTTAEADFNSVVRTLLIRNSEDAYHAWLLAALIPYADAPMVMSKPKARQHYLAELVAREGIKATNKICEIITSSSRHLHHIANLVHRFMKQSVKPAMEADEDDPTRRDTLGMAIREWGATWRNQVLFSLLHELAVGGESQQSILRKYSKFLSNLSHLDLMEAYTFRPIIDGNALADALNTKKGPWMKDGLNVVMAWQLLHPEATDPAIVVEELKPRLLEDIQKSLPQKSKAAAGDASKSPKGNREESAGELLRARLARHILSLIIRPLFAQTKKPSSITGNARKNTRETLPEKFQAIGIKDEEASRPWKKAENGCAIDLLRWVLSTADGGTVKQNWPLLVPPLLTMIDEIDVSWKARGVQLLDMLLRATPPELLAATGLGEVFEESLTACFSYLPSLTPENESTILLNAAYPALLTLCNVQFPKSSSALPSSSFGASKQSQQDPTSASIRKREKFLDNLIRQGILRSFLHVSGYVHLSSALLTHLRSILTTLGIPSVKHLKDIVPLLSGMLSEPLGPAYSPLLVEAAKTLQVVIGNAWPRIAVHRGEVLKGICVCWIRLHEEENENDRFNDVRKELRTAVGMLAAATEAGQEDVDLKAEFEMLVKADERLGDLLSNVGAGKE